MVIYGDLKALMAKYGVTKTELSKLLNVNYGNLLMKLDRTNNRDFTLDEARKITEYFKGKDNTIDSNTIFF